MTTAPPPHRLRQIAILLSSVDAAAARQILLHLPTDAAKQVRVLASGLGAVSAEEKRQILAEFQRSAGSMGQGSSGQSSPSRASRANAKNSSKSPVGSPTTGHATDAVFAAGDPRFGEFNAVSADSSANHWQTFSNGQQAAEAAEQHHPSAAAWTRLSTAALVRFVREERPAVTSVVISQLPPHVAVEVLQHLPVAISQEVLLRLSRLQDIDPEAMQAIDEHLSQRLQQYQHHIQSERENTRRIESLLAAAPPATRQQWSRLLAGDSPATDGLTSSHTAEAAQTIHGSATEASNSRSEQADVEQQASQHSTVSPQGVGSHQGSAAEPGSGDDDVADILPFPHPAQSPAVSPVDRSLIQLEFEQILSLPPTMLAHLLSSTESRTVLLALAGATPEFMRRFYRLLDRRDARALQSRLQQIGAIALRDVDEAQWRIVENAARLKAGRFAVAAPLPRTARAA